LQAVTTVLVGSIAGQNDGQIAANALVPIASKLIGDEFDPKNGSNPDVALNTLSRAVLGAVLAEVNGRDPVAGAAAPTGNLAMQYLLEQYGKDSDPPLTKDQLDTLQAVSQAAGALAAGLAGGNINAAATGLDVAKNALPKKGQ
jgi:filamentous hemagglutinin